MCMTQVGESAARLWDLHAMRAVRFGSSVFLTGREGCDKLGLEGRAWRHWVSFCFLEKSHFPRLTVSAPIASGWQRIMGALMRGLNTVKQAASHS